MPHWSGSFRMHVPHFLDISHVWLKEKDGIVFGESQKVPFHEFHFLVVSHMSDRHGRFYLCCCGCVCVSQNKKTLDTWFKGVTLMTLMRWLDEVTLTCGGINVRQSLSTIFSSFPSPQKMTWSWFLAPPRSPPICFFSPNSPTLGLLHHWR